MTLEQQGSVEDILVALRTLEPETNGKQVWSLILFYSVEFSKSWIGVSKSALIQQTHKQGLSFWIPVFTQKL